jgi:hypothetical protein
MDKEERQPVESGMGQSNGSSKRRPSSSGQKKSKDKVKKALNTIKAANRFSAGQKGSRGLSPHQVARRSKRKSVQEVSASDEDLVIEIEDKSDDVIVDTPKMKQKNNIKKRSNSMSKRRNTEKLNLLEDREENVATKMEVELQNFKEKKTEKHRPSFYIKEVESYYLDKYDGDEKKLSEEEKYLLEHIKSLDKDGDGNVSIEEIVSVQRQLEDQTANIKRKKKIFILSFVVFLIMMGGMLGMAASAVELTKEMRVSNEGAMLASTVALNDSSQENAKRRLEEMSSEVDGDHLGPGLRRALGTRAISQQRQLASTMPDKYFKELQWLVLNSPTSSTISLKITSLLRIPRKSAKCGSLLMILTPAGKVILDDVDMSFDEDVGSLFEEAGFEVVTGITDSQGRRLRMLSAEGFSATGFFNVIDDMEWGCTSVEKPELPSVFSMTTNVLTKCIDKDGRDICMVNFDGNMVQSVGVIEFEGIKYLQETRYTISDEDGTIQIDISPHHPGVRKVLRTSPGQTISYQVDHRKRLSYCEETNATITMDLPDDFIFHYVGEVGNMRQFRISSQVVTPDGIKSDWSHIDYFDDMETKIPKVMIDGEGNVNNFVEFKLGEDMLSFRSFNIRVEEDDFDKCVAVTKLLDTNKFQPFQKRFDNDGLHLNYSIYDVLDINELDEDSDDYKVRVWNFSLPYPPEAEDSLSLEEEDLLYYLGEDHADIEWYDWFNHSTATLASQNTENRRRLIAESEDTRRLSDFGEFELVTMESRQKHVKTDIRGRRLGITTRFNFAQGKAYVKYQSSRFSIHVDVKPGQFKAGGSGCYHGLCIEGRVRVNYPTSGSFSRVSGGGYLSFLFSLRDIASQFGLGWVASYLPGKKEVGRISYNYYPQRNKYREYHEIDGYVKLTVDGSSISRYLSSFGVKIKVWGKMQKYATKIEKLRSAYGKGNTILSYQAAGIASYDHYRVSTEGSYDIIDHGPGGQSSVKYKVSYKKWCGVWCTPRYKLLVEDTLYEKTWNERPKGPPPSPSTSPGSAPSPAPPPAIKQAVGSKFVTRTKSGHKCQKWSRQQPHRHSYSSVGDHNYCSDPDNSGQYWCYTTSSNVRKEECNAVRTKTRSGYTCQSWAAQYPWGHYYDNVGSHNYCSNPDGDVFDWCLTTSLSVDWEYCN